MSYYNTNRESGETLKRSWGQARTQDDYILYIFQEYKDKLFTPEDIEDICIKGMKRWPLTSIRRSLNTLATDGFIVKTNNMRMGKYGKRVHCYGILKQQTDIFRD